MVFVVNCQFLKRLNRIKLYYFLIPMVIGNIFS